MSERQRRDRIRDQRPPSRHMRSLLREASRRVRRLLYDLHHISRPWPHEAERTVRALELCRRATARDPHPAWLAGAAKAPPPGHAEAVAALKLMLETLAAVDIVWDRRLIAAGIDPKWPGRED